MTLATTIKPTSIRCSGGDIIINRIWVKPDQALRLLEIWRDERWSAFQAMDEKAWRAAAELHSALQRAILSADQWRHASRGVAA